MALCAVALPVPLTYLGMASVVVCLLTGPMGLHPHRSLLLLLLRSLKAVLVHWQRGSDVLSSSIFRVCQIMASLRWSALHQVWSVQPLTQAEDHVCIVPLPTTACSLPDQPNGTLQYCSMCPRQLHSMAQQQALHQVQAGSLSHNTSSSAMRGCARLSPLS